MSTQANSMLSFNDTIRTEMKHDYERVTTEIITELKALVGGDNVSTSESDIEEYSHDETPRAQPHIPQVILRPTDTASIARLLAFASERRIPVTPRGAGTGLSGGCTPIYNGIVLSMERMNRILRIDKDSFVAIVEAGVTLSELQSQVEPQGLCYPLYPGEMTATIGGNIATNAGGMNAVKYGVTRHHVLGLEAVLPNGEIIKSGGEFVKCSTGYDLTQLIIGSEGTLAVVTSVMLKLTTRPAKREVALIPFTNLQGAIDAVPQILRLKMVPAGIEFMEKSIIHIVEKHLGKELPYHDHEAFLMIIMEAESESQIYDYFSQVDQICKQHGAIDIMIPGSKRAMRELLDAREKFYPAIRGFAPVQLVDVVVPRSEIARFVARVKEISKEHNIPVIAYGHAGDGNVHLHPVCVDMSKEEWLKKLPRLLRDIYSAGVSLGGAISGEHGIGFDKKPYLSIQMNEAYLNILKAIKRAFDPNNILNPGKIFDL